VPTCLCVLSLHDAFPILLPHARDGFFAMRLADAQAAVAALPWVESAEVRKRWPDVVEVHVVEHRPFARWGSDRLSSEQGRLFPRSEEHTSELQSRENLVC